MSAHPGKVEIQGVSEIAGAGSEGDYFWDVS
jgi:hypothetical protein